MKIERLEGINNRLIINEEKNKAYILKDEKNGEINYLSVKQVINEKGLDIEEARTKLIRNTLRNNIVLDKLTIIRKFKDKGQFENAKKTEKLISNRPAEQYKQIKAEFKFFGQSFLEGFLDFYGIEVDRAVAKYENTLKIIEEQKLGKAEKSYYIGTLNKGKFEKVTDEIYSRELAKEELRKFNASLKKEQIVSKKEELQTSLSNNIKLEKE